VARARSQGELGRSAFRCTTCASRKKICQLPAFLSEPALQSALPRDHSTSGLEPFELFGHVRARCDQQKSVLGGAHLTAKLVVVADVNPDHREFSTELNGKWSAGAEACKCVQWREPHGSENR
jgi:hypothetical protein